MRFNGEEANVGMFRQAMLALAESLDTVLNGEDALDGKIERQTGFVLMVYPLGRMGTVCTVGNVASREEIIAMYKSEIKQFEEEARG